MKILDYFNLQFLLGIKMAPRETENNAYAKFWGDRGTNKEHYDMLRYFLGLSVVVNKWGLSPETSLKALLLYR